MAEEKKSFLIYTNLLETLEYQSNEVAGELFKHMLLYVNDRNPVSDNPLINALFIPIKQKMKFDLDKWEGKKEGYSKAGKMSSLSKSHKDLHSKVKADEMKLEEALKIAETRKEVKTTVEPILKPSKKVKPVKDNSVRLEQFEKVWDIYNLKKDKKRSLALWLKLKESDVDKIRNTIVGYVNDTKDSNFRKYLSTYLSGECWNDEIEEKATKVPEINQGFKNSLATRQNIISLFESDDLTILIEKYKTNKKYLRKRLDEFIYIKSKEKDFGSKTAISQYQYYINHLKHNEPVIVNNVDPNAEAPWVTYAKKHN